MKTLDTFGDWLAYHRKRAGFNQTELAEKAGVSKAYISQLESNKIFQPRKGNIIRIAKVVSGSVVEATTLAAGLNPNKNDSEYVLEGLDSLPESLQNLTKKFFSDVIKGLLEISGQPTIDAESELEEKLYTYDPKELEKSFDPNGITQEEFARRRWLLQIDDGGTVEVDNNKKIKRKTG